MIEGMALADRINCNFCGYANGLTTMLNDQIDQIQDKNFNFGIFKLFLIYPILIIFTLISLIGDLLAIHLVYNCLVAPLLGMETTSGRIIFDELYKQEYAKKLNSINRLLIIYNKSVFKRFSLLLAQIESSWCPIKHLKKTQTVKYPEHHNYFYSPEQLNQAKELLAKNGTVLKIESRENWPLDNVALNKIPK
jgi:hypothetical protein